MSSNGSYLISFVGSYPQWNIVNKLLTRFRVSPDVAFPMSSIRVFKNTNKVISAKEHKYELYL